MEEALAQRQGDSFQVDMGQKSGPVAQTLKRSNAGEANVQVRFEEKQDALITILLLVSSNGWIRLSTGTYRFDICDTSGPFHCYIFISLC